MADTHVCLVQAIVGVIERPHSEISHAALTAFGRATYDVWPAFAPGTMVYLIEKEASFDQEIVALFPHITGFRYKKPLAKRPQ